MAEKQAAKKAKDEGNAAFNRGHYEESVKHFTDAISHDPTDNVLYSNRSGAYAKLENFSGALADAEQCLEKNSSWPKGYSRKGYALFKLGKVPEAIEAYNAGLKLDPENAQLKEGLAQCRQNAMGMVLRERFKMQVSNLMTQPKFKAYGDEDPSFPDQVLKSLLQIIEDPTKLMQGGSLSMMHPDTRVREAVAKILGSGDGEDEEEDNNWRELAERREKEKAKRVEEQAEKEKEDAKTKEQRDADALKQQGNEFYKQRQFEEALSCYDKALNSSPDVLLYNNKAAVYLEMGEFEKCLKECQTALDKRYELKADFATVAKVFNRMAVCYKKMGNLSMCVEMYEKSLMEDNNRHTRSTLKEIERQREKKEKEDYINVDVAEEHKTKGNEFFNKAQYPEAKKEYDEAIRRNFNDPKLYSNRAAALCKLLEYPNALRDVEKALELDPKFVKAWSRKGTIHTFMKAYAKAQEAYQRGLAIDPANAECLRGLEETMNKIIQTQQTTQIDEEQVKQAMADPEIQGILADPQFRLILDQISQNPSQLPDYLKDAKVAKGLQKLISAGIVRIQ